MTRQAIRELNDAFRQSFTGGKVMMTASVSALAPAIRMDAINKVRTFTEFTSDNDPHGEHDFGSFEIAGREFLWKIDYYDATMEFGSENPADPDKTTRVLTLMLASDY